MALELPRRTVRKCYLITYSQANSEIFPTRESFASAVIESFCIGEAKSKLLHWACSKELHKDHGFHYHMSVKFDGNRRWLKSKEYLMKHYGVTVHFSENHNDYYTAYKYVTKNDQKTLHSEGHPDLKSASAPRTDRAISTWRNNSKQKRYGKETESINSACSSANTKETEKPPKRTRLTAHEVGKTVVLKCIKSDIELMVLAKQQEEEGKVHLAQFIFNQAPKKLNDLIATAWRMEMALTILARRNVLRMSVIGNALEEDCVNDCDKTWIQSAKEVLRNNKINAYVFAAAIRELLEKGRGKYRNVMIVGPADCGKTFILNPLNELFQTFTNPATTSYAWVGSENAEVIFLNDFRWSPEILAWKDMLFLLEGQTLHLPAPKTHFAKDIIFERDTPIFATSKEPIVFVGKRGCIDDRETEMMAARWRLFTFSHQIPQSSQKEIPCCKRCFAELVMLGSEI